MIALVLALAVHPTPSPTPGPSQCSRWRAAAIHELLEAEDEIIDAYDARDAGKERAFEALAKASEAHVARAEGLHKIVADHCERRRR
jgi:hypothetical protein